MKFFSQNFDLKIIRKQLVFNLTKILVTANISFVK